MCAGSETSLEFFLFLLRYHGALCIIAQFSYFSRYMCACIETSQEYVFFLCALPGNSCCSEISLWGRSAQHNAINHIGCCARACNENFIFFPFVQVAMVCCSELAASCTALSAQEAWLCPSWFIFVLLAQIEWFFLHLFKMIFNKWMSFRKLSFF